MNLASAFVVITIVVLLGLAVRYLVRNGPCAACGEGKNCGKSTTSCSGCSHSGACHPKQ